ncbi:MAG: hypothetical protein JKY96_09300 [Phycisphaerales bacterium]|nr:hypothetical protein [Phycisphaerales bacterium]
MRTTNQMNVAGLTLAALSGMAIAQSGLDLDRAYAAELRADADSRSSLLGASSNGAGINVQVMTQMRYTANFRDELTAGALGDNDTTVGFTNPRTQVRLSGAVEGTDISGMVVFDFGNATDNGRHADGTAELLVAMGVWAINDDWTMLFGQWHNPVVAEEGFNAENTLAVERSGMNEFFNPGYTQGVVFAYTGSDSFKFIGALADGATYAGNPSPTNSAINSQAENDFGFTGRFDYLASGTWDQFADTTSWKGSNYGAKIGAGFHYQTAGGTNPSTSAGGGNAIFTALLGEAVDEMDITLWTIDAQIEGDGWSVFAAYVGHKLDAKGITAGNDLDLTNHGVVVQGSYFFTDQYEVFARYDAIFWDDVLTAAGGAGADDTSSAITVGANYYFIPESHAAKFTLDVVFTLDNSLVADVVTGAAGGTVGSSDSTTTGLLGLSESETMIRGQMTLLF